ncbi:ABC transporter ATP-binding protein [Prolixibacteraceae bacterium JC049]|nr:ABC transporter ATP-binding protein [Prolixibacteraceae bacterium JC049]
MVRADINTPPILKTDSLTIGYLQNGEKRVVQSNLKLEIRPGEMVCLIGPNGSGKSTLMRTMAGLQPALDGYTYIDEKTVKSRSFKEMARLLSMVLTDPMSVGNLTVYQVVSLGRYPHNNWFGTLSKKDKAIIKEALEKVHLLDYADKYVAEMSDGEKQRTLIAKALAQDTPLIMLDEPTAHLDLPNRVDIMQLLRGLALKTQKAIVLSTHELDLALQAADRIWLMDKNQPILTGTPEDLVLNGDFERTFGSGNFDFDLNTGTFRMHHESQEISIKVLGNSVATVWLKRALMREGYTITEEPADFDISFNASAHTWTISRGEREVTCTTIEQILNELRC